MTNRYPTGAARKVVPDYPRALPRVPANDNIPLPKRPPLPIPANDNIPHGPLGSPKVAPRWVGPPLTGRILGRALPILGWALLAWELWELWRWWRDQLPGDDPLSDYTCRQDDPERKKAYSWNRFGGQNYCFVYQPKPVSDVIPPRPSGVGGRWLFQWQQGGTGIPSDTRYDVVRQWDYGNIPVGTVPNPFPIDEPVPIAPPALPEPPSIPYWWDPMFNPPLGPQAPPNSRPPVRWRPPAPQRPETSVRGNYPPGSLKPLPDPGPRPYPGRPPRGVKERKIGGPKGSLIRKYGGAILSHASEAGDLVDALHDALPDKYQSDGNMADRLRALYEHSDKIDFQKAVANILENNQEDRIWGEGFGKIQDMFEEYGIDVGSLRL